MTLQKAIQNTFRQRNTVYQQNHIFFSTDFNPTRINWNVFLNQNNLEEQATFEEVMKFLREKLKKMVFDRL